MSFEPPDFIYTQRDGGLRLSGFWTTTDREAEWLRELALERRLTYSNTDYRGRVLDFLAWERFGDPK